VNKQVSKLIERCSNGLDSHEGAKNADPSVCVIRGDDCVFEGQRRSSKSPTVLSSASKPSKPLFQTGSSAAANQTAAGAGVTANEQAAVSDVERNVQKREHLEAQLVLQRQLHSELQQHLKLQQEHHQLQAQLMVSDAVNIVG